MLLPKSEIQDAAEAALQSAWSALVDLAAGGEARPAPADCPLWSLYEPIAAGHGAPAYVVAQLGQSLDGRIATASGKSRTINGPRAIRHLHRLRALVDAVVVGVDTVIADDPRLSVREVEGPSPARVVIDPNFRLPLSARMIGDGAGPVYAVQCVAGNRGPGVEPILTARTVAGIAPGDIVAALAARGFKRILIEGGAKTVSAFLAAGVVHRLHLSIAPIVIGSGPVGVNLPPIDELEDALRPKSMIYQLGGDVIFDCAF